ncbi:MAG: acyl--CoA ligase [Solirubrobacterales bacterium]|nr:acyl--CoA ligase [Solirubrobacterales bacterium]
MIAGRPWMRAANFAQVADPAVALRPDQTALIEGEVTLSYGELDRRARRFGGALEARGVGRGDVVALATGNDWRFVEALLGTLRRGAVALPVNVRLGRDALAYVLAHSESKLVIATDQYARRVSGLNLILVGPEYDAALDQVDESAVADVERVEPDELALLMYTSGSTGRPKGVMLSHSNAWWQARSSARAMLHDEHDRGLAMGPLYHANALWLILYPMLHAGGSVVILPDFDAGAALAAIDAHRVTFTSGTPSMYTLLLSHPELDRRDLHTIELLECGSAPVPEQLLRRIVEQFGCDPVETYGLTEGGANVLAPRWGVKKLGSTGLPVPDVELRIVDPECEKRDCGSGEVGELWTRSPANALGYLHDPGATAERFLGDGWLRTGDLVRRDEQGYCFFCGRVDEMISVGGENVYPKEVETILLSHAAVRDAGVVAAAHPVKGQAPVAFVVLEPGEHATEDELRRHALDNGAAYAHPRRVFFVDALPLSATNKLDRGELERRAAKLLPDGLRAGREPTALGVNPESGPTTAAR